MGGFQDNFPYQVLSFGFKGKENARIHPPSQRGYEFEGV